MNASTRFDLSRQSQAGSGGLPTGGRFDDPIEAESECRVSSRIGRRPFAVEQRAAVASLDDSSRFESGQFDRRGVEVNLVVAAFADSDREHHLADLPLYDGPAN